MPSDLIQTQVMLSNLILTQGILALIFLGLSIAHYSLWRVTRVRTQLWLVFLLALLSFIGLWESSLFAAILYSPLSLVLVISKVVMFVSGAAIIMTLVSLGFSIHSIRRMLRKRRQ